MNVIDKILSLLAPDICVGCGTESQPLCFECWDRVVTLPSICYMCGKATRNNMACDACKKRYAPQHVWMVTAYDGMAKELVQSYKFEERRAAAVTLADMMAETLPYFMEPPIVTFVPTATSHRRQRGFDHAELLDKELARVRGWHYVRSLHRVSQDQQHGSRRAQRIAQLKDAFRPQNTNLIQGKHVLLVDDVVTTGSTLNECSKLLYEMGAYRVDAVVFARTMEK